MVSLDSQNHGNTRGYNSPLRRSQAAFTRRSIVETALILFEQRGFADTTIKQVAQAAEVSEQTVYNTFGDKVGLLYAVGVYVIDSGDEGHDQEFLQSLVSEPDVSARIRMVARYSRKQWEEGGVELDRLLMDPGVKDPRLLELARMVLEYKLALSRAICEILFPDSIRQRGIDVERIATYIAATDSGPTITALKQLGWSMDDYEAWIVDHLALFADPAG